MSYTVETLRAGDLALLVRESRCHITDVALCMVITDEVTGERKFLPLFSEYYSKMPRQRIFPAIRTMESGKVLCYRVKDFGDNGVLVHPTTGAEITIAAYKSMREVEKIEFLLNFDKFMRTAREVLGARYGNSEPETPRKYYEYFKRNLVWDFVREKEVVEVPVAALKELLEAVNSAGHSTNISIILGVIPPSNDNIDPEEEDVDA